MITDVAIPAYVRLHNKETEEAKKHQGFKREREIGRTCGMRKGSGDLCCDWCSWKCV